MEMAVDILRLLLHHNTSLSEKSNNYGKLIAYSSFKILKLYYFCDFMTAHSYLTIWKETIWTTRWFYDSLRPNLYYSLFAPGSQTTGGWAPGSRTTAGWAPGGRTTGGWAPGIRTTRGWAPGSRTTGGCAPVSRTTGSWAPGSRTTGG